MRITIISTIARRFFGHKLRSWGMLVLLGIYITTLIGLGASRWHSYQHQAESRHEHQERDRQSWEDNPDKHPHRMAHFGAFAFRLPHPLSIFDSGLESYTGNVVFLEAHKQNTANFSEASLSTGLIRFGDLHPAMLLLLILPLLIFFIGFDAVSRERERRILRLMYMQGVELRELVYGKTLGLMMLVGLFALPTLALLWATLALEVPDLGQATLLRIALLTALYLIFLLILCLGTVLVSAWSRSSTQALLTLLGCWLLLFVVLPKASQSLGYALWPNKTKIAQMAAIEHDVLQIGDSHNPNDPYFRGVRDSLLRVYGVDSVQQLPFNFAGYVMGLGERLTAGIHSKHQAELSACYKQQNKLSQWLSLIDPYLAIRDLSMSLSGTDYATYDDFLLQAEDYRYRLASHMAKLQEQHVDPRWTGGSEGKRNAVSREEFHRFPPFVYRYPSVAQSLSGQTLPLVSLVLMLLLLVGISYRTSPLIPVR